MLPSYSGHSWIVATSNFKTCLIVAVAFNQVNTVFHHPCVSKFISVTLLSMLVFKQTTTWLCTIKMLNSQALNFRNGSHIKLLPTWVPYHWSKVNSSATNVGSLLSHKSARIEFSYPFIHSTLIHLKSQFILTCMRKL